MDSISSIKILFVEDNPQDVELMSYELKSAGLSVTSKNVSLKKDFLFELQNFEPDIVIADYSMPMFNGMHAFRLFKEKNLPIPFILVTGSLDEQIALDCLNEGIDDFVLKSSFKRLPSVILRNLDAKKTETEYKRVSAELEQSRQQVEHLREQTEREKIHEQLSKREYEIFYLIASGKSVKEIAAELFLSPATVATYRARVLEKMQLTSNVDITLYAVRHKLIG